MASATPDVNDAQIYPVDNIKITNWIRVPVSHPATLITGPRTHNNLYRHESGHDTTQILSESLSVRVVLYGSTPVESEHRFWVDPEVTFGGVAKALAEMYSSQELVVLQANWGPRPYWTESHPDSPIGSTCRVLYAILKDQAKPYTMGVVRTSLSDYPIPIYVPASKFSMTLLEAVIASYPKLTGQVKSIALHFGDHELQDDPWDNEFPQSQPYPAVPLFITTLDEPSKEFLAGSLYEAFSPVSPEASTSSDSDGLIPPLLQISFAECKLLVQRAYDLDAFPLQMIHLSEAIFHVVISLARNLTPVFERNSSSIGDILSAEDDLADHLRVAPLLCRHLEELLDTANGIMENLESGSFNGRGAQHAIEKIFATLCSDLPGAVTVRCSENDFKKFGSIDCHELDTLPIDTHTKIMKTAYPELITEDRRVANLDPTMGLDYSNDAGDLSDSSSQLDSRFSSRKEGISESASTLRYPDSVEANPAATLGAHSRPLTPNSDADSPNVYPPASPYLSPRPSPRALSFSHPLGETWVGSAPLISPLIPQMTQPTNPGHHDGSLRAGPSPKATRRYSPLKPKASRKAQNNDPHHIAVRISNLPAVGKRIMSYYAGNELTARIKVLEQLEDYQRQYNDAPVVKVGTRWTCGICSREFDTLQKAAIHVVSYEWKLRPWHCLEVECGRVYGSSNELTRHMKDPHRSPNVVNASIPQQNITMIPGAAPSSTQQTTGTTQGPSLMAMAGPSADDMRHAPASPYTPYPNNAYNRQFGHVGTSMFIGQNPRELPGAAHSQAHSWNSPFHQNIPSASQTTEQLATSWADSILYQVPRHGDPFPGPTGQFIDFQADSTLQQPTIDAPQTSRWSNRLRGHSENRMNVQSTSQDRLGAGTPPTVVRHHSGEHST